MHDGAPYNINASVWSLNLHLFWKPGPISMRGNLQITPEGAHNCNWFKEIWTMWILSVVELKVFHLKQSYLSLFLLGGGQRLPEFHMGFTCWNSSLASKQPCLRCYLQSEKPQKTSKGQNNSDLHELILERAMHICATSSLCCYPHRNARWFSALSTMIRILLSIHCASSNLTVVF